MTTEPKKAKKLETAPEKTLRKVFLDIDFDCIDNVGDLEPEYEVGRKGVTSMGFIESEYGDPVLEIELQQTKSGWRGDSDLEVWVRNFIQIPVSSILYLKYEIRGDRTACCGSQIGRR